MSMGFARFRWLVVLAVLIALAYLVPYAFLSSIQHMGGAFAFWTVFGLAAVGLIVFVVSRWKV